jgi:hypothetical protein
VTEVFGNISNKFAHDESVVGLAHDLLAHRSGRFEDNVCHGFASSFGIKRVCTVRRISRPTIHRHDSSTRFIGRGARVARGNAEEEALTQDRSMIGECCA